MTTPTTRPDRPQCAARQANEQQCTNRAALGSRYCKVPGHLEQRPREPLTYLAERLSARTPRPTRVHLGYMTRRAGEAMTLLCTGTAARPWVQQPVGLRTCPKCRRLAFEAVARGELEPDDLRRWNLGEPNVDEARS